MKAPIFIATILIGLIAAGCSFTSYTYLSLTESNKEQVEEKIKDYQQDEDVGAEVILSLKMGIEISGEILSVSDSTVTMCSEYSATEEELANLKYPITTVRNDEIQELTIKGSNCVWIGFAIGSATFTGIGIWIGHEFDTGMDSEGGKAVFGVIGFLTGAIVGSFLGYFLSTDDVILHEIPPVYNLSLLKPLARYPDEEPEYLRAIK
jgi:hypothetical protein